MSPDLIFMYIFLIVMLVIAVVALGTALPTIINERREYLRRKRLTPMQRALEDLSVAFQQFSVALTTMFVPVIDGLAATMNAFSEAIMKESSDD